MAYVSVESDDRMEEGPEGLQFKSFLGADPNPGAGEGTNQNPGRSPGVGNSDREYLQSEGQRKGSSGFWTIEYYQPYFDVDTKMVLRRCYSTLNPAWSPTYISTHLNPADLYGPFWTLTTLIFTLFLSSSLAASISTYLSAPGTEAFDYNFQLLSIAVTLVYTYGIGIPFLLWIALRYIGVGEWSVIEAIAVWGYGQFVWIPVSILCVIPVPVLRWTLVGLGFGISGWFLVANIYPILSLSEAKATRLIIIIIAILHAGLALTFKILFFSYYVVPEIGPGAGGPGGDTISNGTSMLLKREFF